MNQRTARRPSPTRRWSQRLAIVAAVGLLAAACASDSSDSGDPSDADGSTDAAEVAAAPTADAAPATTAPPATATTAAPQSAEELIAQAFANSRGRSVRGDMTMRIGEEFALTMEFAGDGTQNFEMTSQFETPSEVNAGGFGYRVRYVDGKGYMQVVLPEAFAAFVDDSMVDGWYTLDAESAAFVGIICPSPVLADVPQEGGCLLPNDYMNQIEYVSDAEIVGTEEINGIPTTKVRYRLDYAGLTEAELGLTGATTDDGYGLGDGTEEDDSLSEALGSLSPIPFGTDLAPPFFIFETWIDADGLTRRTVLDFSTFLSEFIDMITDAAAESGNDDALTEIHELSSSSNELNFHEYDVEVEIEAPAPEEILGDVRQLYEAFGQGGFGGGSDN